MCLKDMKLLCGLFFVSLLLSTSVTVCKKNSSLQFGYITSLTGSFITSGSIPVVDLALKLINEKNDILENYTLGYTNVLDSKVILYFIYDD